MAIEAVCNGQTYLTPAITRSVLETALQSDKAEVRRAVGDLTIRQREVLQLIGEGKSTKDIATLLKVSVKTVEFHKGRLMEQLDVHSTADLIKFAISEGLAATDTGHI